MRSLSAVVSVVLVGLSCGPASPARGAEPPIPAGEISVILRELLLPALPQPLAKSSTNWDHQEKTFVGLKWVKGNGILLKPEPQYKMHNAGIWRRIHADAIQQIADFDEVLQGQQLRGGAALDVAAIGVELAFQLGRQEAQRAR